MSGQHVGDVDGDGLVGFLDTALFDSQFESMGYRRADLNFDGVVNLQDSALLALRQGTQSPVSRPETRLVPAGRITPPRRTLIEGEQLVLEATDFIGAVSWAFVTNRTGASIGTNSGNLNLYTAGNVPGTNDVIQAWDSENRVARTYLNVISNAEVAKLGKAIIVAGGQNVNDPVWAATDYLSGKAYNTLRYRGFSRDNIRFLSFGAARDVDGDGDSLNDISHPMATSNDVEQVFTSFAAGSDRLTVYMVDHGVESSGGGRFRLNGDDFVDASEVDT